MEKDKKLQNLFEDLYQKPSGLDKRITERIEELTQSQQERADSSIWLFLITGIVVVFGVVYSALQINFKGNSFLWLAALSVFIPLMIDKMISISKARHHAGQ